MTWRDKVNLESAWDCEGCNGNGVTAMFWDVDDDGNLTTSGIQPCETCQKEFWNTPPEKLVKTYSREELYGHES